MSRAARICFSLTISFIVGLAPGPRPLAAAEPPRPNIVFILLDNVGQEWFGCYGSEEHCTPNIDELARTGVRVENCYTPPVCGPSRVVLLTGRYPHSTGFRLHHDAALYSGGGLRLEREIIFPRLFRDAGYATGITGKWQINNLYDEPDALSRHGFQESLVWPGSIDRTKISPAEWELTAGAVRDAYRESAQIFARDALLGVYTRGDAALDPRAVEGIVASAADTAADVISVPRLVRLYDATKDSAEKTESEGATPFESLENEVRAVLRATLARSLASAKVAEPTQNAILFALEWGFTSYDHTVDLADEDFAVAVTLPGTLVGGNFESSDGPTARWEFEGSELDDRDVVLRAISVLD